MPDCREWSRRDVLKLAGGVVAAAVVPHSAYAATPFSMPGQYRGRVIGVTHSGSSINGQYLDEPIRAMIRKGMMELTGSPNYVTGWRKIFQPGDVVGIKVNPNGMSSIISSRACLLEIIQGLLLAGIAPNKIVVYERYQDLLGKVIPWLPSWVSTSWATPGSYVDDQTGISGYDPNHYIDLPQFLLSWQDARNPAHTRSYAALFVARQVTKIISLSVLKDHNAAGVTLGLKNLSHGCTNNVNRSHPDLNTNYLQDYIPAAVSMPVIRNKTVLSIIDGVHGLYALGPYGGDGSYVWEHKTMYFATDVVAGDRIGWLAVDAQRVANGLLPEQVAPPDAPGLFNVRQPQHILVAGQLGLGEAVASNIDFRKFTLA